MAAPTTEEDDMLLATTTVEDFDQFEIVERLGAIEPRERQVATAALTA